MKSFLRRSKCDRSKIIKVERIFVRGWFKKPRHHPRPVLGFKRFASPCRMEGSVDAR